MRTGAPPTLAASEPGVLAGHVGQVVMVARANEVAELRNQSIRISVVTARTLAERRASAPEGSYATNAADGATRIREFRQMVMALHRAGLRVVALAIQRSWIVRHHKDLQELYISDFRWIKSNLHDFYVTGSSRADLLIGRHLRATTCVPGDNFLNTVDTL